MIQPTLPLVEWVTIDGASYFFLLSRKCASNSIKEGLRALGATFYQKRVPVIEDVRRNPFPRIGVVRHPVSRLLSCWRHCVWKRKARELGTEQIYDNMPWGEFVAVVCSIPDRESNRHFRSYSDDLVIDGQFPDHVLHVERLERDWFDLSRSYGWRHVALPHRNATEGPGVAVTKDQLRVLAKRYATDAELFKYDIQGWTSWEEIRYWQSVTSSR